MGVLIGLGTGPAGEPVHGSCAGPGADKHVVAGRVQQFAGCSSAQIQGNVIDQGCGIAVNLVPADAARRRRVKAGSGSIVIGRLYWINIVKIKGFVYSYVRFVKKLIRCAQRCAHDVFHGGGRLVLGRCASLGPLVERIETAVVFGIGSALQRHGVNGTIAVAGNIDILCGNPAFFRTRSLRTHGLIELFVGQVEILVHLLHRGPLFCQLARSIQCLPGFFLVFFFRCICCFRVGSSIGNRITRPVIAHYRHAVDAQVIYGNACANRSVGIGTAQGQPAYNVGNSGIIVGRHGYVACGGYHGLIIHQDQAVAVPCQHVDGTGNGHITVCLACAQDNGCLDHFILGI